MIRVEINKRWTCEADLALNVGDVVELPPGATDRPWLGVVTATGPTKYVGECKRVRRLVERARPGDAELVYFAEKVTDKRYTLPGGLEVDRRKASSRAWACRTKVDRVTTAVLLSLPDIVLRIPSRAKEVRPGTVVERTACAEAMRWRYAARTEVGRLAVSATFAERENALASMIEAFLGGEDVVPALLDALQDFIHDEIRV